MTTLPATDADNSPIKIFQEKIASKIRDDIGNLMPDELLQKLVSDAIKTELYKDVSGTKGTWNHVPRAWIVDEVNRVMGQKIKATVEHTINEHEAELKEAVKKAVLDCVAGGMATALLAMMRGQGFAIESIITNLINSRT